MTNESQQAQSDQAFTLGVRNFTNWDGFMDQLVQLRKAQGVSQREMAKRLQISQPAVAQFELSSANPTIFTIIRYANAIGVEVRFDARLAQSR